MMKRLHVLPLVAMFLLPATQAIGSMDMLEEVVVTAQKREQSLQDVPISISTVSSGTMEALSMVTAKDLQAITPGLVWAGTNDNGKAEIFLRGVGFDDFQGATGSPVALYQDGIVFGTTYGAASQLFDIARVEVLKGPQGTLWGKNSTGGLLHFIPEKPEVGGETNGYLRGSLAEFGTLITEGAIGGSLGETTAGRLSVKYSEIDGYFNNSVAGAPSELGANSWVALRGQFLWEPSDVVSARFSVNHSDLSGDGAPSKLLGGIAPAGGTCSNPFKIGTDCEDGLGGVSPSDAHTTAADNAGFEDVTNTTFGLHVEYDMDWVTLTSITGFQTAERDVFYDDGTAALDGVIEQFYFDEYDGWTQELRLASNSDTAFNWQAGLYFSSDEVESFRSFSETPFAFARSRFVATETDVAAIFVDGTYDVSDTVSLTAGLRLTRDERSFDFEALEFYDPLATGTIIDAAFTRNNAFIETVEPTSLDQDWTEDSWRLAANWNASEEVSLFASISKGFRGGEVNAGASEPAGVSISEPETLLAYEIGLKSKLLDNRLGVNASYFFYDYDDKIMFVEVPQTVNGIPTSVLLAFNGSKVEIQGLELEVHWQATERLFLSGNATYTDGEYLDVFSTEIGDIRGNTTENTPETSFSLIGQYVWELSNGLEVSAQLDYSWRDDFFFSARNTAVEHQESYGILGGSVTVGVPEGDWDIKVWGKNLGEEEYVTDGYEFEGLQAYIGAPRVIGLTANYRY